MLDSRIMPIANITRKPAEKFRSLKMRGGINVLVAVNRCTTNR